MLRFQFSTSSSSCCRVAAAASVVSSSAVSSLYSTTTRFASSSKPKWGDWNKPSSSSSSSNYSTSTPSSSSSYNNSGGGNPNTYRSTTPNTHQANNTTSSSSSSSAYNTSGAYSQYQQQSSSSSSSGGAAYGENMENVNYYNSKAFMGKTRGTTVICKQKPVVKSWYENCVEYLRPKKEQANTYIEAQQLLKLFGYLTLPAMTLIWWKSSYEDYPDYWEKQAAQVQARPLSENVEEGKHKYSYFDVIGSLETKREAAMVRKGYDDPGTSGPITRAGG